MAEVITGMWTLPDVLSSFALRMVPHRTQWAAVSLNGWASALSLVIIINPQDVSVLSNCVCGGELRNWNRGARALLHSWACICHMHQTPSDYLPQFSFWQMLPSCSQKRLWHFIIDNNVGEGQASLYRSVRLMSILRKVSITIHPPGWHGSRLLLVQRHSCPPPPALF